MIPVLTPEFIAEYKMWRRQGLRAVTAFGFTKYGWDFIVALLLDDEEA